MISIRENDNTPLSQLIDKAAPNSISDMEAMILNRWQEASMSSFVVKNDEKLLGVWGIVSSSVLSNEVYLWLHVTPEIKNNQFVFIRHSQLVIERLLGDYEAIIGHVKADATSSKRWLKWLGAKFSEKRGPLISFRIERKWPIQ